MQLRTGECTRCLWGSEAFLMMANKMGETALRLLRVLAILLRRLWRSVVPDVVWVAYLPRPRSHHLQSPTRTYKASVGDPWIRQPKDRRESVKLVEFDLGRRAENSRRSPGPCVCQPPPHATSRLFLPQSPMVSCPRIAFLTEALKQFGRIDYQC